MLYYFTRAKALTKSKSCYWKLQQISQFSSRSSEATTDGARNCCSDCSTGGCFSCSGLDFGAKSLKRWLRLDLKAFSLMPSLNFTDGLGMGTRSAGWASLMIST